MDTIDDAARLYEAAMTLSQSAFATRHYAVAYHELAAALHAAADLGDDARLAEVEGVAEEQGAWLDDFEPEHLLSTRSATRRHSHNVWALLQREAQARRQMLEQRRQLQHMQPPTRS